MPDSLLPLWPGWHRMPPPIEVRWSREAWEALYGEPWQPHWKPWPWEPPQRSYAEAINAPLSPEAIDALNRALASGHPARYVKARSGPSLEEIHAAHEAVEAVWMHGTAGL